MTSTPNIPCGTPPRPRDLHEQIDAIRGRLAAVHEEIGDLAAAVDARIDDLPDDDALWGALDEIHTVLSDAAADVELSGIDQLDKAYDRAALIAPSATEPPERDSQLD